MDITIRSPLLRGVLAALALLAPLPAAAQQDARTVTVTGAVVDRASQQPVTAARVWFRDRPLAAYTDAEGRFTVKGVTPGTHVVRVDRIGYQSVEATWEVGEGGATFTVPLTADALMLPELVARVDELEQRRNAAPVSVRVIPQERLAGSGANTALEVLGDQGLRPMNCQWGPNMCARVRGRVSRVRLFIDENLAVAGLAELNTYRPQDFYMMEVFGGGAMVRAYTLAYMERAARHKVRPEPLSF